MPITNLKLVLSGEKLEVYQYDRPVLYGQGGGSKHSRKKTKRIFTESNLYTSKKSVKRILQCNAERYYKADGTPFKSIFITFTFKDEISDLTQANKIFKKFIMRLNYYVYENKTARLKYLAVPEIQRKRADKFGVDVWHYHVVFFNLPFIDRIYDEMARIWGEGFVLVKSVNDKNHLVNYLAKYFTKSTEYQLMARKKYFCSKGLYRSFTLREQETGDFILENIKAKKINETFFLNSYNLSKINYHAYILTDEDKQNLSLFLPVDNRLDKQYN